LEVAQLNEITGNILNDTVAELNIAALRTYASLCLETIRDATSREFIMPNRYNIMEVKRKLIYISDMYNLYVKIVKYLNTRGENLAVQDLHMMHEILKRRISLIDLNTISYKVI